MFVFKYSSYYVILSKKLLNNKYNLMDIFAEITEIKYQVFCYNNLSNIDFDTLDINLIPSNCIITRENFSYGISKWVSPKRTRSYPFERVYNTLYLSKKITIIPIIKDEGLEGDRDFIQWDTISLMSLLDVYVILAYYQNADKHKSKINKITNQQFDSNYIKNKIKEISSYHSSALHWNIKEVKESLPNLIIKVKNSYAQIENDLGIKLHDKKGINNFEKQIIKGVDNFINNSREKAQLAQKREQKTIQPKEMLASETKATITISNFLGGLYYLTTDEIKIEEDKLYLIEAKHTKNAKLPSWSDIKDGLLKMILYTNLKNVLVNQKSYDTLPILKLSSSLIKSNISSKSSQNQIVDFIDQNQLNNRQKKIIDSLFKECQVNNFLVIIEGVK